MLLFSASICRYHWATGREPLGNPKLCMLAVPQSKHFCCYEYPRGGNKLKVGAVEPPEFCDKQPRSKALTHEWILIRLGTLGREDRTHCPLDTASKQETPGSCLCLFVSHLIFSYPPLALRKLLSLFYFGIQRLVLGTLQSRRQFTRHGMQA